MHVKRQVRDAIVKTLSVSPINWKYVYNTRLGPQRDVLPYLMVWIDNEVITPITIHPTPIYDRNLPITIVARTRIPTKNELFEDELDEMQEEIEQKLLFSSVNTELGGFLKSLFPQSAITTIEEDENSRRYAQLLISYVATINTQDGTPETLI